MIDENIVLDKENLKKTEKILVDLIRTGIKFNQGKKIIKKYDTLKLINLVKSEIPTESKDLKLIIKEFKEHFLPYCINQAHPNYLAFPDSGNSIAGFSAEILKPFLNQNLIADVKSAPLGTFLEIQVISWFRQLVGYSKSNKFPSDISKIGGVITFGGVLSNIIALLLARSKVYKNSFRDGINKKAYLIIPDIISHYSKDMAMGYLGLGEKNIVKVKIDKNFKMDLKDLKRKIYTLKKKNKEIIAVCAYAGDSRTMQIDNLEEISKICKKNNLWFHVDGCHGGSLLFSSNLRKNVRGIENADSITLDPHKTLMIPYPCSIVLFKNPLSLMSVSKNYDMTILKNSFDLGQITPFIGSKSFESLKLWFLIKSIGKNKIGEIVEKRKGLTEYFKKLIDDNSDFISLNNVNINSIVFIFFPKKIRELYQKSNINKRKNILKRIDNLNSELHDNLYYKGDVCIHTFKLVDMNNNSGLKSTGKRQVLGVIIGNPQTNSITLKRSFNVISKESENILKKLKIE